MPARSHQPERSRQSAPSRLPEISARPGQDVQAEVSVAGRRWGFAFAIAATMLMMVAASAPSPFYPLFAERLRLPPVATTLMFAVYAFTMLAALLLTGAASDALGRRPVVAAGAALLAVSLVLFWQADSLPWVLVARSIQGIAAGLLLPALSAMVVDFAPPARAESASLWNTISAMSGLGVGAITAAVVLDVSTRPAVVVFASLAGIFVAIAALVWAVPAPRRARGARVKIASSRPAVPWKLRGALKVAIPAIIAGWATNGLFLALGSSLVKLHFGATSHAMQSSAIPVFAVSGIAASVLLHRRSARVVSVYGTAALGLGTALSLLAVALHVFPAYLLAVALVGTGFGTAFMGVLKTLMPRVDAAQRAAVMAVVYIVSYLAFGLPTIVAGLLVPVLTLQGAMSALGGIIVVLSAIATVKRFRI